MGILDAVKGALWDDTPTAGSAPARGSQPPPITASPIHAAPTPSGSDPAMRKRLLDRVTMSLPPSCKELLEQLTQLAEDVVDERAKFRQAVKSVTKHGHPIVEITSDLDRTIMIVDGERERFEADIKAQTDARVGSKTSRLEQIEAAVAEKRRKITELEVEISGLGAEKASVSASIQEDSAAINASRDQFVSTHSAVRAEFVAIRDKTKTYAAEIK